MHWLQAGTKRRHYLLDQQGGRAWFGAVALDREFSPVARPRVFSGCSTASFLRLLDRKIVADKAAADKAAADKAVADKAAADKAAADKIAADKADNDNDE